MQTCACHTREGIHRTTYLESCLHQFMHVSRLYSSRTAVLLGHFKDMNTKAGDTRHRSWCQKLLPETCTQKFGAILLKSLNIAGVKLLQAVHKTHTTLVYCSWFSWATLGLFFNNFYIKKLVYLNAVFCMETEPL